MADVRLDYAQIETVDNRLHTDGADIQGNLRNLLNAVTTLLTSAGGLWLQQSSPVLSGQYTEFHASLTAAIDNLGKFGDSFNAIATNVQTLDNNLAGKK